MKIKPARIEGFLLRPDPGIATILLYGPDQGLVGERARKALGAVVDDPDDPFLVVELEGDALRTSPGLLVEEAQALSFTGGRKVVRVRRAVDGSAEACRHLLALKDQAAFVILEAGDLGPSSSLRKLMEKAPNAAALPCYRDDGAALSEFIRKVLGEQGLTVDSDALDWLQAHCGSDRDVTRRELEKLALYMADKGPVTLRIEDVAAVIGDSSALALDDLIWSCLLGRRKAALVALDRLLHEGEAPVRLVRSLSGTVMRLLALRAAMGNGTAMQAIDAARPPIHFRQKPAMRQALERYSGAALARLLARCQEVEQACKSTGTPDRLVLRALVLGIADGQMASLRFG